MKFTRIQKLYVSNFLTGLVFWYGIEKLFMASIGIDAVGIAIATAVFIGFNLLFDIPSGILADKWSRTGMLIVSALSLAVCSILLGSSTGLSLYIVGEIFYGIYIVSTSGTYAAITYDILHEEGRTVLYSKIAGRAYALFLAGAGAANVASGFIASHYTFRTTFYITVVSCLLNVVLLLSLREPTFHKREQKERVVKQLKQSSKAIANIKLLRVLVIVLSTLAVAELFKGEFSQLYMLRYISTPQMLGILWAAYAFTWSLGSLIAHRVRARLDSLIIASVAPFIIMSFIDHWFSLVLFMVQAVASAALINQIETRIQENTPSAVRASVLSVASTIGRAVSVPSSFILGWLIREYDVLWALRFVAIVMGLTLAYWLLASRGALKADVSEKGS